MKFIKRAEAQRVKTDDFLAHEYDFGDPSINIARIELSGRYPESGRMMNTKSRMCCYVLSGTGTVTIEGTPYALEQGDALIIDPKERYFWDAEISLLIASAPAWTNEQARATE